MNKDLLVSKINEYANKHHISESKAWMVFNYMYYQTFKTNLENLKKRHCIRYGISFLGLSDFVVKMGLIEQSVIVASCMLKGI